MISIEILGKLSLEELAVLQKEVEMVLVRKRALITNSVQYSQVSERCKKVLQENNIENWDELSEKFTEEELRHLRHCGAKTVLEILNELDERGLKLRS